MSDKTHLRLLHTSDLHLGLENGTGHPGDGLHAAGLKAVIDTAQHTGIDLLLMAGDVFDNSRVPNALLEFFLEQVDRLEVPVVVLPGNHDCYDVDTVYLREPFRCPPTNLYLISEIEGETKSLSEIGVSIWGRAMVQHLPTFKPLDGIPSRPREGWFIVMAHGHYHDGSDRDQRSSPIYEEDIVGAGCDYIALGHWDRHVDLSQGTVKACYSGSPTSITSGSLGGVVMVDMDPLKGVSFARYQLTQPG